MTSLVCNEENLQNDFANLYHTYLTDNALDFNIKFNRFLSSLDQLLKSHAQLNVCAQFLLNGYDNQLGTWRCAC